MSSPKAKRLVKKLTKGKGAPGEAVVLRGYLDRPRIVKDLEDAGVDIRKPRKSGRKRRKVAKLLKDELGRNPARIYLSAKMDCWVDFDWDDDLIVDVPPDGRGQETEDFTTTVWLKTPRYRSPKRQYRLVTSTVLTPPDGFVRGKLVDDFMDDAGARVTWDEQGYAPMTAARSHLYCT